MSHRPRATPARVVEQDPFQGDPGGIGGCRFRPLLFQHEVRRDGHVVATLRAHETADGVTVEAEVFPVTQAPGEPGVTRPFAFASLDHAHRFADDALVAFEYLNCTVT